MDKIHLAEKYFLGSKRYDSIAHEAIQMNESGLSDMAEDIADRLPNDKQLYAELLGKLEGKPVHKTLTRLLTESQENKFTELKGWSSLMTHALIECEAGNTEYKLVVHQIYEKLGTLIL